jgi:hypothetical protein
MPASKNPAVASANARRMAIKRHHPNADTSELDREIKEHKLADYIRELADTFPPLRPEQRDRLALLLRAGASHG